ncbi:imidazolonepropionase-like amidohydrolase [Dyadobacter sp. BE34]|uniref:Imidazolonepropionase-like amidohydrolase n=1 Tax=Dyadobacter fermentans TaxID=94254 RepID=A0ABU1R1Z7_9BACT|nr:MULTISPECIES: amidohydrolase family protein [Dyadobacter]MDR6807441.1 imidazolonepropionase-like amidohydrolase [Dyadobacter fermentans]MDR7045182.1 imidazolonepropionase-like amidohydrolase [Dyadobacter sp. BE242]MDR7199081.1 imidazolonepropionase-like amidohydrolase [Dyadobacter sp. BE34]MDR7217041.1 imidazolonepropionase-like amidohydrolase [Dyadobacter sp. BE31]MDR7264974.1 imidazolonepropionase-like amidohydrolase [Dyadobacter sp. BE32]
MSRIREINQKEIIAKKAVIAITGATIIDGTGGAPIENGCVIVTDGMISAVDKKTDIAIPGNAQIVDASGLTLLPGFIDSHFHLDGVHGLPAQFLQNGVTSLRDPGAWIEAYDEERKSGKRIPRLFLAGPHIDMFPPAYPHDAYVVRDADEAVREVNHLIDQGASVIKVYFRLPPAIIREVCKAAHARGIPVTGHLETTEAREAIEAGLDGVEHITSFGLTLVPQREGEKYRQMVLADNNARKPGRYAVWKSINPDNPAIDSLGAFLKNKGTFVSPTLGAFEYQAATGQPLDTSRLEGFIKMKKITGQLHRAGTRIVVGSHAMIPYAETGWAFQREMELLVESGLRPAEVIAAATLQNARFFRIEDRLGSIEKGKQADLILIKGDPLKNISATRNVKRVMLNGIWVK